MPTLTGYSNQVAQCACETICVALNNYNLREGDQEVFGIGVRHRYFTFWHAYLEDSYLQTLKLAPNDLKPNDLAVLKQYPISQYGLDICKPTERLIIVQQILSLFKYVKNSNHRMPTINH